MFAGLARDTVSSSGDYVSGRSSKSCIPTAKPRYNCKRSNTQSNTSHVVHPKSSSTVASGSSSRLNNGGGSVGNSGNGSVDGSENGVDEARMSISAYAEPLLPNGVKPKVRRLTLSIECLSYIGLDDWQSSS